MFTRSRFAAAVAGAVAVAAVVFSLVEFQRARGRAREMDERTARFLASLPLADDAPVKVRGVVLELPGDPQEWNRYAFSRGEGFARSVDAILRNSHPIQGPAPSSLQTAWLEVTYKSGRVVKVFVFRDLVEAGGAALKPDASLVQLLGAVLKEEMFKERPPTAPTTLPTTRASSDFHPDATIEAIARIDITDRTGESRWADPGRILREVENVIPKMLSVHELRHLYYLCIERAEAEPPVPQEDLQKPNVFWEASKCVLFRIADLKSDAAARVLVALLGDPTLTYSGESGLNMILALATCGRPCVPYLRAMVKGDSGRKYLIDEALREIAKEQERADVANLSRSYARHKADVRWQLVAHGSWIQCDEALLGRLAEQVPEHKAFFREEIRDDLFIAEFVLLKSKLYQEHTREFEPVWGNYDARRTLWVKILADDR